MSTTRKPVARTRAGRAMGVAGMRGWTPPQKKGWGMKATPADSVAVADKGAARSSAGGAHTVARGGRIACRRLQL